MVGTILNHGLFVLLSLVIEGYKTPCYTSCEKKQSRDSGRIVWLSWFGAEPPLYYLVYSTCVVVSFLNFDLVAT